MGTRRALLIGVEEFQDTANFASLPVVERDVEAMYAALRTSDYHQPDVHTSQRGNGTSRGAVRSAIRDACKAAGPDDVLLIYYSGHGINVEKRGDYLVPSDGRLDDPSDLDEDLLSLESVFRLIADCGARLVVFITDACREGLRVVSASGAARKGGNSFELRSLGAGDLQQLQKKRFVRIYSCPPGDFSSYPTEREEPSYFTAALAHVLDSAHPARTLREIKVAAQQKLQELCAADGEKPQVIWIEPGGSGANDLDPMDEIICDGSEPPAPPAPERNPWFEWAFHAPLWKRAAAPEHPAAEALQREAARLAEACWQPYQSWATALPDDPWRDDEVPRRTLEALYLLTRDLKEEHAFNAAEVALLVVAPFVREALLATATAAAVEAHPFSFDEPITSTGWRSHLWQAHQAHERHVRSAERLRERGQDEEFRTIALWLAHQAVQRAPATWQQLPAQLRTPVPPGAERLLQQTFHPPRLLLLGRCAGADPEAVDRMDPEERSAVAGPVECRLEVRVQMLGYLLSLAGIMAFDPRQFGEVVVDHVGLTDPVRPAEIQPLTQRAQWIDGVNGLSLDVACRHPALDLALRERAEAATAALQHLLAEARKDGGPHPAFAVLPPRLCLDRLRPEKREGEALYTLPHVLFRLAHDEVRELLMGEQLYGDPTLAIRELYQNALDACRYRQARERFRLRQRGLSGEPTWEGRIEFEQGVDEHGRAYIECRDNGVGMGRKEIEECFARAGRRFHDMPEFIEEQARWATCDPPIELYPNSRFGIGVFSYFMLADELEVETRRYRADGTWGEPILVRVAGSGSLFRITPARPDLECGTRLRLYLNLREHQGQPISCLQTLKEQLWVAEFDTAAHEKDGGDRRWPAGELCPPDSGVSRLDTGIPGLWWVTEGGAILADGILAERASGKREPDEDSAAGEVFVADLRGKQRPRLSLDRGRILGLDREWLRERLRDAVHVLPGWKPLTFAWLFRLAEMDRAVASAALDLLLEADAQLPVGHVRRYGNPMALAVTAILGAVGLFSLDEECLSDMASRESSRPGGEPSYAPPDRKHMTLIRCAAWKAAGLSITGVQAREGCWRWEDAVLLSQRLNGQAPWLSGPVSSVHVFTSAQKLGWSLARVVERLGQLAPLGLELPPNLALAPDLEPTREDLVLLSQDLDSRAPWLSRPVSPIHVFTSAQKLGWSLARVVERLGQLAPLGLELPPNLALAPDLEPTDEDLVLLSQYLSCQAPWLSGPVSSVHVLTTARQLQWSQAQVVERLTQLEPLGLEMPHDLAGLADREWGRDDLTLLSRNLDGEPPWLSGAVTPWHMLHAERRLLWSRSRVVERLRQLPFEGIDRAVEILESLKPDETDHVLLSQGLDSQPPLIAEGPVDPWHVMAAEAVTGLSREEIVERLRRLEPLGIQVPPHWPPARPATEG